MYPFFSIKIPKKRLAKPDCPIPIKIWRPVDLHNLENSALSIHSIESIIKPNVKQEFDKFKDISV